MPIPKNNNLLPAARELRRRMTPQERKLWYAFLKKYPLKIYKQRIIGSFIVDFYCHSARLAIEIDGAQHFTEQGKACDKERNAALNAVGIEVLRFSNYAVDSDFKSVCETIDEKIKDRVFRITS